MTNVRVNFEDIPDDFETFCTTFRIEGRTPDNINLYFSPFNSRINRLLFYGGIQTHIDGVRSDGRFVRRNRGAIFSRWRERDTDAIMPANGGLSRSLGSEGDFISVRNDFVWGQGRYRLCLRKSVTVDGDPLPENYDADDIAMSWGRYEHTWVRMEATDMESGETTFVGALAIPGTTLALQNYNVLFAEIYGSPNPFAAERVPELSISVENFQVDGKDLRLQTVTSASNTIPGNGSEPKLTRIGYESGQKVVTIELGRFTGRFGRVSTAVFPSRPAVESVGLVTAEDQKYVAALWDGRELNRYQFPSGRLNVRAETVNAAEVASVRLELRGPVSMSRLAKEAPYLLSGGSTGLSLPEGDYRITATPFSQLDGKGQQGASLDAEFSVTSTPLPTEIEDQNLLAHLETALDTELTEDNIAKEMESVEILVIAAANITSLDGLQLAKNLQMLRLPRNHIRDLAPLSRLSSLRELDLSGNRIEDVTPLCDLIDLRRLDLGGNKVSDIGPLAGLGSLEHLDLSVNEISDLNSLVGLAMLKRLELAENSIRDLRPLSALVDLEYLDISENPVATLDPLATLIRLREFVARENRLSDIQSLAGMVNLRRLEISRNLVSDLKPLSSVQRLTHLAANQNRIVRLDPLSGLLALERLELDANWVADLAPLAGLNALSRLNIRNNRIDDFSPLHPLIANGLEIVGLADQLRAIMERPPERTSQDDF